MVLTGGHAFVKIGPEDERLGLSFAFHIEFDGGEGRVLHRDPTALNWSGQPIDAILVPAQH